MAQLLGALCVRTLELSWVPCSPQALGKELSLVSLVLLFKKAGTIPQHTGLGA